MQGHTRLIPRGQRIARVLRQVWARQQAEVAHALRLGQPVPNLARWTPFMVETLLPVVAQYWQQGGNDAANKIRQCLARNDRRRKGQVARMATDNSRMLLGSRITKDIASSPVFEFGFNVFRPEVIQAIQQAVYLFCAETNATSQVSVGQAVMDLRRTLGEGLERGEAIIKLNERVGQIFQDPYRAARIAQTEASRAMHAGDDAAARQSGVVTGKKWLASSDACPLCLKIAARGVVPMDEPFYVDPRGGPYAVIMYPPAHPHCVLGETPVSGASLVSALHAKYQGPIVRLHFSDGSRVSVTANHMLLCRDGFARATDLVEGDDVFRALPVKSKSFPDSSCPNDDGQPSLAKDVFNAFSIARGVFTNSVPMAPEYIHGDGAFGQGHIHVVRSDSFLRDRDDPILRKPLDHLSFVLGIDLATRFARGRDLALLFKSLLRATNGRVGRSRELAAHLRSVSGISDELSIGGAAWVKAHLLEATDYRRPTDAERLGHTQNAFPRFVTTTKVVKVDQYLPHEPVSVYDFETDETMYLVGNGIISSNCFCTETHEVAATAMGELALERESVLRLPLRGEPLAFPAGTRMAASVRHGIHFDK